MARAFIASVPPALLLVGALVVPLAVIPGTFGFDSWPSSRGERITERQVRLSASKVDVVAVRPRKAVPERHQVFVAARPQAPRPVPRTVAVAFAPRRAPVVRVSTPAPKPDRPHASTPSRPAPVRPQTPQAPQTPPQQPTKNDSGLLAGGDVPVAREVPHQETPQPQRAPAPVPAPVAQPVPVPAPVERAAPSEPCHGNGNGHAYGHEGGQHGHGRSDG